MSWFKKNRSKEKHPRNNNDVSKEYQRKIWKSQKYVNAIKIIGIVVTGTLVLMLFWGLVNIVKLQFDTRMEDFNKTASLVNTFTGIVLGFVAMAVSLIGMVLSFHNTIRTEESNRDTLKEFTKIAGDLKKIEHISTDLATRVDELKSMSHEMEKYIIIIEQSIKTLKEDFNRALNVESLPTDQAGKKQLEEHATNEFTDD